MDLVGGDPLEIEGFIAHVQLGFRWRIDEEAYIEVPVLGLMLTRRDAMDVGFDGAWLDVEVFDAAFLGGLA